MSRQGVAGNIETDGLFFVGQENILRPFFDIRKLAVGMPALSENLFRSEERFLTSLFLTLELLTVLHRLFKSSHKLSTFVLQ